MGMVLQVQVIWQLLNLCIIVLGFAAFTGSSVFDEQFSLLSSSHILPIESEAADSVVRPGLFLQPSTITSSSKSPQTGLTSKRPLTFQSSRLWTTLIQERGLSTPSPTETTQDSAPSVSAESPYKSAYPVTKLPHDTLAPQFAETPLEQPHYSTSPPAVVPYKGSEAPSVIEPPKDASPPSVAEPPHASVVTLGPKLPKAAAPLPTAKPPKASDFQPPAEAPPFILLPPPSFFGSPQSTSYKQSPPMSLHVLSPPVQLGPSLAPSPPAVVPSNGSFSPPLILPLPAEPPPLSHSPHPADRTPLYEPPPPNSNTQPLNLSTPLVAPPSHISPLQPGAEAPHFSSVPLAAKPPTVAAQIPALEPPEGLTFTPPPMTQPVFPSPSPSSAVQPPPVAQNTSSPPTQLAPSDPSSPPFALAPPTALSPPPLDASSPPPSLPPHASQNPPVPPSTTFPPPLIVPPPLQIPSILPSPSPAVIPNASSLPPQLGPPYVFSPHPQAEPPPPPFPSVPPSTPFPPPQMVPPPSETPPFLPSPSPSVTPNASSLPPQLGPPYASPPPQLVDPPPASSPTPVLPSIPSVSPPSEVPPPVESPPVLPSPPTAMAPHASSPFPPVTPPHLFPTPSAEPPHVFSSPPPIKLSPVSPPPSSNLPVAPPPYASSPPDFMRPPVPPVTPPHFLPPPSAEPPQAFSSPPPIKLPHVSPPPSSNLPAAPPPYASSPPHFLPPPVAAPPSGNPSYHANPPPVMVPSHALSAPPPAEQSYHPVPPSPAMKETAVPPHSSQRNATHEKVPPPLPTSPGTTSRAMPPVQPKKLGSPPLISHVDTPMHSPPSPGLNASEPHAPPLPASAPRNNPPHGLAHPTAPPSGAPGPLSPAHTSPRLPGTKFGSRNGTAPAPSPFQVNPLVNGSHHSPHHSSVPGSPMAVAPSTSPSPASQENPKISSPSPISSAPPGPSRISPSRSLPRAMKPRAPPIQSLPPPPPNADCAYQTCQEPYTNRPPGSPCGCVWPMQVGLRLSVALYTFFPLATELAEEIAAGVFLKQSQVRVMGANSATEESDESIVIVDLVPPDESFDSITSHLISDRFWQKQVVIDKSIFGNYDVLYVRYPGLPPSPPMAPADIAVINGMPYSVGDPTGSKIHPLGVDVTKQRHKHKLNAILIAVIALSAVLGVLICSSVAWILVFRHTNDDFQPTPSPRTLASIARPSGPTVPSTSSGRSLPLSLGSSLAPYTGSAKTFSASELEKATDNFNPSNVLGEGGFGLVYSGVVDEETKVAVKVLKRDDQQGGREFLAEVEMLSRLHHRNLVKLIGICIDERMRCLVYELIPNGSVDSHLHGPDKEVAPLDWASRMKIALGAARGLAYLHEDSSPRVIHRDFKSSNILLENDFTAKVSDFGLARNAMDEENRHISTRVMGTFGYVAPEYAMTGHLLVKSDVYSYGVVLLELLTGMKPVDMSQPAGQENLVTWARPLLTSREGLESIIDPSLGTNVPIESVAKVAAIASMCVQPEVSHRPFMGEVVQALKLVCDECDDSRDGDSRHHSHENLSIDFDAKVSPVSGTDDPLQGQFSLHTYTPGHDLEKGLSVSEIFSGSATLVRQSSDSFRRHSASGPLRTEMGRFWQKMKRSSNGSVSEHGVMYRLWGGSH